MGTAFQTASTPHKEKDHMKNEKDPFTELNDLSTIVGGKESFEPVKMKLRSNANVTMTVNEQGKKWTARGRTNR
jgi:hypothetical protein